MRETPTFENIVYAIVHNIGALFKKLFLSCIFTILRLLVPTWFMYMMFTSNENINAFNKMSSLDPCDPQTDYVTTPFIQNISFCIVIGVLAVIVFKAEEDMLRLAYWLVIYLHLGNNREKYGKESQLSVESYRTGRNNERFRRFFPYQSSTHCGRVATGLLHRSCVYPMHHLLLRNKPGQCTWQLTRR